MATTTTTTTDTAVRADDKPTADSQAVRALIAAIGTIDEAIKSNATFAFRQVCERAHEHESTVLDIYNDLKAASGGDISFRRFYDAIVATARLLPGKVAAPNQTTTRQMFVFATKGSTENEELFLDIASTTGEYEVSLREYVRFLGNRNDYTATGRLTKAAKDRREAQAERRANDEAVRKAAKTARPLAFDFDTLATANKVNPESKVDYVKFLMLLQQDLGVAITNQLKAMTDDDKAAATRLASDTILAAVK